MDVVKVILIFYIVLVITNTEKISGFTNWKTLSTVRSFVNHDTQTLAVEDMIKRVLGKRNKDVSVKITPGETDTVKLHTDSKGILNIEGVDGVTVAFGLNYYLKYYCKKHLSWAGDQMDNLPNPFPSLPTEGITLNAGVKYRYYQNVCTVSYSSVWWNWTRWEREIDWMALNGINLPLAFTGQEALWYRVYSKLGCTQSEILNHFAGPAFLAWGRMGNIHGWGGPLPLSWINNQLSLQHKILKRMKSLGMIPVLPAFAGHIPEAITNLFKVNATKLDAWSHFNCTYSCTYLLEPEDPLFLRIGKMFIEEQQKEYNETNHIYSADTFNEMQPRSSDIGYLSNTARAVYDAMAVADTTAVWLMQSWLFHHSADFWQPLQRKALLTAVPIGKMMVLDLFSEAYPYYNITESYYGQPFIWCMLHDFGGNLGFYGKIESVNKGPEMGMKYPNSSMVGIGITPEGINQNYIIYEFMLENGFFTKPTNIQTWVRNFVERRYGVINYNADKAWQLLISTIYNDTGSGFPAKTLIHGPITNRPNTNYPSPPAWYNINDVYDAWSYFIAAVLELPNVATVRYDAIDITRQALQTCHTDMINVVLQAYNTRNFPLLIEIEKLMFDLLDDLDTVLLSGSDFQLGKWLADSRAVVNTSDDKILFEYNARAQITTWGPSSEIVDYANKLWGSLVKNYYKPRWVIYLKYVHEAMAQQKKFRHKEFQNEILLNVEEPFIKNRDVYPSMPVGDSVEIALKLFKKWNPICNKRKS